MMDREKDEREMEVSDEVYGGGSRSTGDSESDNGEQKQSTQNSYKKQQSRTVNEGFA